MTKAERVLFLLFLKKEKEAEAESIEQAKNKRMRR
jgi:hypothetical protein